MYIYIYLLYIYVYILYIYIYIYKHVFEKEHITKFIGVFIDENLSWKQHFDIVSSKLSKHLGIFYKSREVLNKKCLKELYFSFFHNYVNYANIVLAHQ